MPATPEPPRPAIEPERQAVLRGRAASRLKGGAATQGGAASAANALSVLHALASSPDTAAAALTLLHELQVHQVELELQAQELRESRIEMEAALRRQVELYDFQPVGCFTIDAATVVHELNRTAAEMLGVGREDMCGLPLDAFFCAESALRFKVALHAVATALTTDPAIDAAPATCWIRLRPKHGAQQVLLASLRADPAQGTYLVTLTAAADDPLRLRGTPEA